MNSLRFGGVGTGTARRSPGKFTRSLAGGGFGTRGMVASGDVCAVEGETGSIASNAVSSRTRERCGALATRRRKESVGFMAESGLGGFHGKETYHGGLVIVEDHHRSAGGGLVTRCARAQFIAPLASKKWPDTPLRRMRSSGHYQVRGGNISRLTRSHGKNSPHNTATLHSLCGQQSAILPRWTPINNRATT